MMFETHLNKDRHGRAVVPHTYTNETKVYLVIFERVVRNAYSLDTYAEVGASAVDKTTNPQM